MTDPTRAATDPTDGRAEPDGQRAEADAPDRSRGRAAGLGLVGGAVATAVMTAFRMPITDSLPPTAEFWARYVGNGESTDYPGVALLLHAVYGMGAGAAFAAVFLPRARGVAVRDERRGTLLGAVYGLVLSVFGTRVMLSRLLGLELAADERWIFHVSHVVYGLTLGAWLGSNVPER